MANDLYRQALFDSFCGDAVNHVDHDMPTLKIDSPVSNFSAAMDTQYDDRINTYLSQLLKTDLERCLQTFAGHGTFFDYALWKRSSLMIDAVGDSGEPFFIAMLFNSAVERILKLPIASVNKELLRPYSWNFENDRCCIFVTEETFFAQFWNVSINHTISTDLLSELQKLFTSTKESLNSKVLSTTLKLTLLFRNLSDAVTVGITLMDLCLLWDVMPSVAQKACDFASEFMTSRKFFGQSAELLMSATSSTIATVIAVILSVIGTMKIPNQRFLDFVLKRTNDLGRACKGFSAIMECVTSTFNQVYSSVYVWLFGALPSDSDLKTMFDGMEQWFVDVKDIASLDNMTELSTSYKTCRRIEQLFLQGVEYLGRFKHLNLTAAEKASFMHYYNLIAKIYDRVVTRGIKRAEPRTEPLIIHLFGETGVGKSGLTYLLSQDILSVENMHHDTLEEVYFRNVEQEYWDGYKGQTITVYDDFGQMKDTLTKPNPEFMEVIRSGNIAPMNLHMAHLEEKDKTKFKSRALILTSNKENFAAESLTCREAFERRLDIHYKVQIKSTFKDKSGMVDASRVNAALSEEIYEFVPYTHLGVPKRTMNSKGKDLRDIIIDYPQFRDLVLSKYVQRYKSSRAKIDCLSHRATVLPDRSKMFMAQAAELPLADAMLIKAWLKVRVPAQAGQLDSDFGVLGSVPLNDRLLDLAAVSKDFASFEEQGLCIIAEIDESLMNMYTSSVKNYPDWYSKAKGIYFQAKASFDGKLMHAKKLVRELFSATKDLISRVGESIPAPFKAISLVFGLFIAGAAGYKMLQSKPVEKEDDCRILYSGETMNIEKRETRKPRRMYAEDGNDTAEFTLNRHGPRHTRRFKPEAAVDPNARELISGKLQANTYLLSTFDNVSDQKILANVVFVRGRIGVFVHHAVRLMKKYILLQNAFCPDGFRASVDECIITRMTKKDGTPLDLVTIEFPRRFPQHPDIVSKFVENSDINRFVSSQATLCSVRRVVQKGTSVLNHVLYSTGTITAMEQEEYHLDASSYLLRSGYKYRCETLPGDCTAPLVLSAPTIQKKIIGFHVAGNRNGEALAQAITQATLLDHLHRLSSFSAQVAINTEGLGIDTDVLPKLPKGNFIPIGKTDKKVGRSIKTKLSESPLNGSYHPALTKPAHLANVNVDGVTIDPMEYGLAKFGNTPPVLDGDILRRCKTWLSNRLKKFRYGDARVLTWEESLSGIEGDPWIQPVNRKTSAGYPWIFESGSGTGKRKWLGSEEEWIYDHPDLIQACEDRIRLAKQRVLKPPVFIDTLKDERRPIKKVDQGKTRVFSAGPMDFIINVRQYFLSFNAAMMENRIDDDLGVGINPFSNDWHRLAMHLKKKGNMVWAGDYSNYDATLPSELLEAICEIINNWYDDGEENRTIREVLFAGLINALHLNGNNVVMFTHSQPSGNPLTTTINCLANLLIMAYNFVYLTGKSLSEFDKLVSRIVFGDDHVINVHPSIAKEFNQVEFARACKEVFNMDYTDEAKTGILVPVKELSEVTFLKRDFYFDDESSMYIGRLDLDVVLEIPQWVRGDLDLELRCVENCESAFKELSLYDETTFNSWAYRIFNACIESGMTNLPELLDYFDYKSMEIEFLIS